MNLSQLIGILLIVGIGVCAINALSIEDQWRDFKSKYNKTYTNFEEEIQRFKVFKDNCRKFSEHNKKFEEGAVTFKLGVNKDADQTVEEMTKRYVIQPE